MTVPSSLASSQMTATGGDKRKNMARPDEIARAHVAIGERAHRIRTLLGRNPRRQSMTDIGRHSEGGAERRVIGRDHRSEVQPPRIVAGQRNADDAAAIADDERHLLGCAKRSGDDQVALVLAIVVIGDGDDLATGESLDGVCDGIEHVESLKARWAAEKIVRRDGPLRLGDDPLGGFAGEPRAMFAADQGDRAGRNADAPGEVRTRHLVALKPIAELHCG
jgi:hypothetical protein